MTASAKAKILIVDDKRENIVALKNLLDFPEVEILTALSGNEALGLLLDHQFALALLDVQMPEMSGFELARLMRGTDLASDVPIIFVTAAKAEQSIEFSGYEKGAVDVLFKPLNPTIVRSKVTVFVELFLQRQALQDRLVEVEALKVAAEAANEAKSKFIANMSHEIRTPLSAILGFAQILQSQKSAKGETDDFVEVILRNGNILSKILNDLLDVAKIDAGKLAFEKKTFSLPSFIDFIAKTYRPLAGAKSISFQVEAVGAVPAEIKTDEFRLQQAINNLLSNAIKFTTAGKVEVLVSYERENEMLRIDVRDTGCGLTDEAAQKIFLPFEQADVSTSRRFGGTGLGLFISKHIATELGGNLELKSYRLNQGCTFSLTIKAYEVSPTVQQNPKTSTDGKQIPALLGKRILVVDDSEDLRFLITTMLKLLGAQVAAADGGRQAQEIVKQKEFDVLLLDMQMPELDGAETLKFIRADGCKTPAICVTAHASDDARRSSIKAGFDAHVSKPVSSAKLSEVINSLFKNPS